MKIIPITRGMHVVIDDQDYEWATRFRWFAFRGHNGVWYAIRNDRTSGTNRAKRMHRELMQAASSQLVDHINGDGLDNRRSNLRLCNPAQNGANGKKRSDLKRFKGVYRLNQSQSWHALIVVNRERHYLGAFRSEEDAARAYDQAALLLHGAFARTNEALGLFNGELAS